MKIHSRLLTLLSGPVLRVGISLGILFYIFHSSDIAPAALADTLRRCKPGWLLMGFLAYALAVILTLWRWHLMLLRQGVNLRWRRTLHIGMIGVFFNSFMLGSTGGDLIKAFYVSRETTDRKTAAITTVFADRIFGLLGMFLLAGVVAITHLRSLSDSPPIANLILLLIAAFIVCIFGLWLLAQYRLWLYLFSLKPSQIVLRWIPTGIQAIAVKVYQAFHLYYQYPFMLSFLLLLSAGVHAALVLNAFALARSLGIVAIDLHGFFLIIPIVTFAASVPLSISGLGIRDQMVVFLLASYGVPEVKGLALSLLIFAAVVAMSLLGGVTYIFRPGPLPKSDSHSSAAP